jgi:hypothetical protein
MFWITSKEFQLFKLHVQTFCQSNNVKATNRFLGLLGFSDSRKRRNFLPQHKKYFEMKRLWCQILTHYKRIKWQKFLVQGDFTSWLITYLFLCLYFNIGWNCPSPITTLSLTISLNLCHLCFILSDLKCYDWLWLLSQSFIKIQPKVGFCLE